MLAPHATASSRGEEETGTRKEGKSRHDNGREAEERQLRRGGQDDLHAAAGHCNGGVQKN